MLRHSKRYINKINPLIHNLPKVKKNEILVVPSTNQILECEPYISGTKLPDWWKDQAKIAGGIKRCYGTLDYVSLGVTIPLWTNVYIRPSNNKNDFEIKLDQPSHSAPHFNIEGFPAWSVTDSCPFASNREINGGFPKLVTPWLYKTAPGYSSLIMPMSLEPNPNYDVMPGVVHTDYYHHINIVLFIKTREEFVIPVGTPMYQIVPFKRSDKISKIIFGNETMFPSYAGRGTGDMYLANNPRKNIYRKLQLKIDEDLKKKKR